MIFEILVLLVIVLKLGYWKHIHHYCKKYASYCPYLIVKSWIDRFCSGDNYVFYLYDYICCHFMRRKLFVYNKKKAPCPIDPILEPFLTQNSIKYSSIYFWKVPHHVHVIYVTIVGGGGSGSNGSLDGGLFKQGNGGASGSSFIQRPFAVKPCQKIVLVVGNGGFTSFLDGNGADSLVISDCETLVAQGGLGGSSWSISPPDLDYNMGYGGFQGERGQQGPSVLLGSLSPAPMGGASAFAQGGSARFDNVSPPPSPCVVDADKPQTNPLITRNGKLGSGGAGGVEQQTAGKGGDGFILITW